MAVINGTDLTIYIPTEDVDNDSSTTTWEPIALARSATINLSLDTPDASTKDSSGWAEVIGGQKSWTADFEGLVDFSLQGTAQPNVHQLWLYFTGRSKIKIAFGQDAYQWYGDAYITSLEQSAEAEQPVTFSGSLQGTSVLTYAIAADIDVAAGYPV